MAVTSPTTLVQSWPVAGAWSMNRWGTPMRLKGGAPGSSVTLGQSGRSTPATAGE